MTNGYDDYQKEQERKENACMARKAPFWVSNINSCIKEISSDLKRDIRDSNKKIDYLEKELKERWKDFDYDYSSYGTVDDRWINFYANGKRHKVGGQWQIDSIWDSIKDNFYACMTKPPFGEHLADDKIEDIFSKEISDLAGEYAELDQMGNLLESINDIPDEELKYYESEY